MPVAACYDGFPCPIDPLMLIFGVILTSVAWLGKAYASDGKITLNKRIAASRLQQNSKEALPEIMK
ncbi:MAG: hypothetical protein QXX79_01605 [Candidatus Bathyarchaeia archaeon]